MQFVQKPVLAEIQPYVCLMGIPLSGLPRLWRHVETEHHAAIENLALRRQLAVLTPMGQAPELRHQGATPKKIALEPELLEQVGTLAQDVRSPAPATLQGRYAC